ncbi:unnamed protein product, partial [Schistosoma rodhaini]
MICVIYENEYIHNSIVISYLFQLKLKLLIVEDSQTMMTFAFTDVFTESSQNHSHCISTQLGSPLVLTGLILTLIGVVLGLIIILVRKLHVTTILNIMFMVITMIILFVGVALLMSPEQWYEIMISAPLSGMFCILAIFSGSNLQLSNRRWKIILFTICCVFVVAGFILYVVGLTLPTLVLQGLA